MPKSDKLVTKNQSEIKYNCIKNICVSIVLLLSTANADLISDAKQKYKEGHKLEAQELYTKSCDNGSVEACLFLGGMYYAGKGVEKDILKAKELNGKICDMGYKNECFYLGVMYSEGSGNTIQNKTKAEGFFNKACIGGHTKGCIALGWLYYEGDGIKQDKVKAMRLFSGACDMGDKDGCTTYRVLIEREGAQIL